MQYKKGIDDLYFPTGTAVSLGKFDGLHRGHQKLLNRILAQEGCQSVMFTINRREDGLLLTVEEKCQMLRRQGLDCLIDCPFVPEVTGMEAEVFAKRVLAGAMHAAYIAVGEDFRFGYQRRGDVSLLLSLQESCGFRVDVIEKERCCGREISSTLVKAAVEQGEMERAYRLLGYPYFLTGTVRTGKKLGRTLGIPTANIIPSPKKLLPPDGVYFSRTKADGQVYDGVTNIGYKPTVDGTFRGVETYLFDFEGDLYGKDILVELWNFERPEKTFASVDALKAQMQEDIGIGKEYFREQ